MPRRMVRAAALTAALAAAAATAGCENFRDSVGLTKNPPDEFKVVSREPLTVPPDFNLRPPEPGAERPARRSAREQAEQTVFKGDDAEPSSLTGDGERSAGERALLAKAGADDADPEIRQKLSRETDRLEKSERNFVDSLIFWQEPEPKGKVVDAEKEARRLRENAALGKDLTEGETPTIERKERGFLEGIFN